MVSPGRVCKQNPPPPVEKENHRVGGSVSGLPTEGHQCVYALVFIFSVWSELLFILCQAEGVSLSSPSSPVLTVKQSQDDGWVLCIGSVSDPIATKPKIDHTAAWMATLAPISPFHTACLSQTVTLLFRLTVLYERWNDGTELFRYRVGSQYVLWKGTPAQCDGCGVQRVREEARSRSSSAQFTHHCCLGWKLLPTLLLFVTLDVVW